LGLGHESLNSSVSLPALINAPFFKLRLITTIL
jgi:hypothetical protein